jgi:hypothetical protein
MPISSRAPCLKRGAWKDSTHQIFLQFSSGRCIRYDAWTIQDYNALKAAVKAGTIYNLKKREGKPHSVRIAAFPSGLTDEFLGVQP